MRYLESLGVKLREPVSESCEYPNCKGTPFTVAMEFGTHDRKVSGKNRSDVSPNMASEPGHFNLGGGGEHGVRGGGWRKGVRAGELGGHRSVER